METQIEEYLRKVFSEEGKDIPKLFNEKLEESGLSKRKVCQLLTLDQASLEAILKGNAKQPSLNSAIKIAQFLEIDINELILHVYRTESPENINSLVNANKAIYIAKKFDITKLKTLNFFEGVNTDNLEELENRILTFFGFSTLTEFDSAFSSALFSKVKRPFTEKMKDFWIRSAIHLFQTINNPNQYDRKLLIELIPKIKPYSQDVNQGLLIVSKALYNAGVTVIFQQMLPTTSINGATLIINGKPCIVLTDYNKSYPKLWFTLIHELHHVLYDYEHLKSTVYHLSGEPDLYLIEEQAEKFASDYFCDINQFHLIQNNIQNDYFVNRMAEEMEVHPSILYGSYQHYQNKLTGKYFGIFKQYFPDIKGAIKNLNPVLWNERSLQEIALEIKNNLEKIKI